MKRVALVIGVNRYPLLDHSIKDSRNLRIASQDATDIGYFLERYGNFEVTRYPASQDAWKVDAQELVKEDNLKNEIIRLFQPKVNVPETALLFFAGRGFRQATQDGVTEGFLGTSDTNPRKKRWGVSLKWLRQVLQNSPVHQQIVWLDCSFSGELFNFIESEESNKKRQRCFITATQEFEEAIALTREEHGLLTRTLLDYLLPSKHLNGTVTSIDLAGFVNLKFAEKTAQLRENREKVAQRPICSNMGEPIILTTTEDISIRRKSEHRLQRLWRETEEWFSCDDDILMKHSPAKVCQYFAQRNLDGDKAKHYRTAVETILGGTPLPDSWWQEESVYYLHESLKSLCGDFFSGRDNKFTGKRHISVGAAYLMALMSHQEIWPNNIEPLTKNIDSWIGRTKASKSWLFPLQDTETAKSSAIALYDLFLRLFESQKQEKESQVRDAFFGVPGNILRIEFNWKANKSAEEGGKSLADWTYQVLETEGIFIPDKAGNTRNAILRLMGSMFVSKVGFMSPGVVYMSGNELVVASIS